ncbi:MAG TPA: glycosyltransferase family 39 protein [Thermoanaerobaculia bacterium]|nr:glycosyltransferase family 39 protein [Thermoanaerobaculia bacterium]
MSRRFEGMLLAAIAVAGLVRVAATHHVFSAVIDEPVHIAAGYDWLHRHTNAFDPVHPPLARIVCALPLMRFPPPSFSSFLGAGNDLLYTYGHYVHNLGLARRGNLLFLLLAMLCVWWWARRTWSAGTALLAVAFLASMPPILGHAGVVTTDMAVAATLPLALIAFERWLERRDVVSAVLLGLALGAGLLSKFSFLAFFPICAAALLLARVRALRSARGLATIAIALAVAFVVLWAGYFFTFDTMGHVHHDTAGAPLSDVRLPAPLYWAGLRVLKIHDEVGQLSFLLGRYSERGFWYYFPVIFFFKTPIPFLILMIAGIVVIARQRRGLEFVLMPLALMLFVMTSHINIGVRHILPIYPPLCVVAAVGAMELWRHAKERAAATLLMAWLFAGVALAHPDYLAWFNEFAGRHPERIAVDSNLDWGQDILRLGRVARRHHIERGAALVSAMADLPTHGYPAFGAPQPFKPMTGWIAVSETELALDPATPKGGYDWLTNDRPYERVGKSIRLYNVKSGG